MKSIQTFLEELHCIPLEEKPTILLQAWFNLFAIKHDQSEDSNELFQKLLEDLKGLAEYANSPSRDRSNFLNDNEDHYVQNKESLENSSEIASSNSNQEKEEPPQDSDIRKLIREECSIEVCEEQKQKMEDTMLELVEICRQKQLLCMHDNFDDLIESALNSKLLSINSQHLDKEQQKVKNVVEQPAERGNRSIESLQNFRVVYKSSTSLNNTSQISLVHAVAPILSTKVLEYSPSMGYEHLSTSPETKSDEIIKSGVKELVPILSENEVTSEDKRECDVPVYENFPICDIFSDSINDDDISKEEDDLEDISQIQDVDLREKLLSITRLIANIESLNDNLTPDCVLNSSISIPIFKESNNSLSDNFSPEFETFCDHTEETRSGNTIHADNSLPEYDLFCFEIELDQERLINAARNDISDDSSNNPLLEKADLFLSDNSIPSGIENSADNSEGDICFLEALLIDDSIPINESSGSDFDNPSFPRPPPKPPDVEPDSEEEIPVVINDKDEFDDENYYSFIFVSFPKCFLFYPLLRVRILSLTLVSPFRASGISLGWNFHVFSCLFR
uniref:Uncharacterized protein n=1 Tax=Tanacetum cinerariifolium TaxID=118510 RepID=A0A699JYP4_TANCI|nr:hypothetical protein [Tanacetum cinerariifolium]